MVNMHSCPQETLQSLLVQHDLPRANYATTNNSILTAHIHQTARNGKHPLRDLILQQRKTVTEIRSSPVQELEMEGIKPVVCTLKHPMMQCSPLVSKQALESLRWSLSWAGWSCGVTAQRRRSSPGNRSCYCVTPDILLLLFRTWADNHTNKQTKTEVCLTSTAATEIGTVKEWQWQDYVITLLLGLLDSKHRWVDVTSLFYRVFFRDKFQWNSNLPQAGYISHLIWWHISSAAWCQQPT